MEIEGFKSAWQKQSLEARGPLSSGAPVSRSLQFLRTSSIRDLHRSEELSRSIFSLLFALVAVGVSIVLMAPGTGRVAAWLFALALLVDGIAGMALLTRRLRQAVTSSTLEFIKREHSQIRTRLRFERYAQRLILVLGAIALLLLLVNPAPADLRRNLFDPFGRMAVMTAFLALVWRRAKSRSKETCRELEHFLKDLQE